MRPVYPRAARGHFHAGRVSIADINAAFDAGALSCEQLVQLYLDRVAAYDDDGPRLNSIITVNPRALDTARALDGERSSSGPRTALHCIPRPQGQHRHRRHADNQRLGHLEGRSSTG